MPKIKVKAKTARRLKKYMRKSDTSADQAVSSGLVLLKSFRFLEPGEVVQQPIGFTAAHRGGSS